MNRGQKDPRLDESTQEDYGIYKQSYTHESGVCYLYVNGSKDKVLEESVQFNFDGLQIEGKPD